MNTVVEKKTEYDIEKIIVSEKNDPWADLCDICSSLVEEAHITKEDARKILKEVRENKHE